MAVGDQKTITISGKEYILQKPPARWVFQVTDRATNKFGVLTKEKYIDELIKGVVVNPKVTLDDFEDIGEATQLIQEIESFLGSSESPEL